MVFLFLALFFYFFPAVNLMIQLCFLLDPVTLVCWRPQCLTSLPVCQHAWCHRLLANVRDGMALTELFWITKTAIFTLSTEILSIAHRYTLMGIHKLPPAETFLKKTSDSVPEGQWLTSHRWCHAAKYQQETKLRPFQLPGTRKSKTTRLF